MYSYYRGGRNTSAPPEVLEMFLMDEYHWTPNEISKIPYKKIQKLFLVRNQKAEVESVKSNLQKIKSENKARGSQRGSRKFTREV